MNEARWEQMLRLIIASIAIPLLLLLAAIPGYIFYQSGPALDWQLLEFTAQSSGFGNAAGILPMITGSLVLALGACVLATPFAVGTALYLHCCAGQTRRLWIMTALKMLLGIPPIVFGLCGLVVFVHLLHWGISLASGILVLAMVILPFLTITVLSSLERIDEAQMESAKALGMGLGDRILTILLPQSRAGIFTGLVLAIARGLSETAPILLTATVFSGVVWPDSIFSPVTTLQTNIFYLAQEGTDAHAIAMAWASAAALLTLILMFSLIARYLRK